MDRHLFRRLDTQTDLVSLRSQYRHLNFPPDNKRFTYFSAENEQSSLLWPALFVYLLKTETDALFRS